MKKSKEISRRAFLKTVASTTAAASMPVAGAAVLAGTPAVAEVSENGHIAESRVAAGAPPMLIENPGYRLMIDPEKGGIVSIQSTFGVDRELLIARHYELPLFRFQTMDDERHFRSLSSLQAKKVVVSKHSDATGETIAISFQALGDPRIHAHVTVRCPTNETLTYWDLEVENGTNLWLANVQFPVIQVPFDELNGGESSHILAPVLDGILIGPVHPEMGSPQGPLAHPRRNSPEVWRTNNYPGRDATAQVMAYYNATGGLYLACEDPTGIPKRIDPLLEEDGVTMGLGHFPCTRGPGKTKLAYSVVVGTFHGDWYRAAEIYREWASRQPFCATKMAHRKDVAKWITEPAVALAFPMRGEGDWDPPAKINPEYTPATNALPYLDKLAGKLDCPLMPIVFNWEHSGPWVQPEAFPPLGGEASMKEFMTKAKEKGWHPTIYGDGCHWITWQRNTGYNGMPYFRAHHGEALAVRNWDGELVNSGSKGWRGGYFACMGTKGGREMILGMTRGMADFGPDVIQQFDQGPGATACYAKNHEHPPLPGPWMAEDFKKLLAADAQTGRTENPTVAMSCEGAPPECYLQDFQIWDSRIEGRNCPLYSFLYHEYANGFQGFYTNRISDEALRLSVARALVTGYLVSFTLRNEGMIEYDWDQLWTRAIPDQAAIIDWASRTAKFRGGIARDFLVFGRMLRPYEVTNVAMHDIGWGKEPLVQSATWQSADGRIGVVLANCGDLGEAPRVMLEGKGDKHMSLYLDGKLTEQTVHLPYTLDLDMQPRSLCLIELK